MTGQESESPGSWAKYSPWLQFFLLPHETLAAVGRGEALKVPPLLHSLQRQAVSRAHGNMKDEGCCPWTQVDCVVSGWNLL